MALEKDLEKRCRLLVESRGGKMFKWRSPGNKGVPDRIVILDDCIFFVEFKKPGGRFQPLQLHWRDWLRQRGHRAYVVDNYPGFIHLLPELRPE